MEKEHYVALLALEMLTRVAALYPMAQYEFWAELVGQTLPHFPCLLVGEQ